MMVLEGTMTVPEEMMKAPEGTMTAAAVGETTAKLGPQVMQPRWDCNLWKPEAEEAEMKHMTDRRRWSRRALPALVAVSMAVVSARRPSPDLLRVSLVVSVAVLRRSSVSMPVSEPRPSALSSLSFCAKYRQF